MTIDSNPFLERRLDNGVDEAQKSYDQALAKAAKSRGYDRALWDRADQAMNTLLATIKRERKQ